MSTEIQHVVRDDQTRCPIMLNQFGGGKGKGLMVQITAKDNQEKFGHIQITRGEAIRLAHRLMEWADNAAIMGDGCND